MTINQRDLMAMLIMMKFADELCDLRTTKGLEQFILGFDELRSEIERADIRVHETDEIRKYNEDIQKAIRDSERSN